MKTKIIHMAIPDDLARRAKITAAETDRTLIEVVCAGIEREVTAHGDTNRVRRGKEAKK